MKIRVYTKIGRQEGLLGWDGDKITVGVDAPPVDGAANMRLIEILSEWLGIAKSNIEIVKGHTSRYKTLDVGTDVDNIDELLDELPRLPRQQKMF